MNPESLVLQPKVTEVRCSPQIGQWLQLRVTSVHTLTGYFSWLGSSCYPASVWLPSDESIRLLPFICGSDSLKWWKRGLTKAETHDGPFRHIGSQRHLIMQTHSCTHSLKTTAAFHFRAPKPQSDFNQEHQSTNCCCRSVSVNVCNGQICANLPVASVFVFFFSLSLSADSHWHTEN